MISEPQGEAVYRAPPERPGRPRSHEIVDPDVAAVFAANPIDVQRRFLDVWDWSKLGNTIGISLSQGLLAPTR